MDQKRRFSAFIVLMSVATLAAASDAIDAKYKAIGAATLGKPAAAEKKSAGGGRVRLYANGGIYWSNATGTHAVYGPAYDKYKALAAEGGTLGYPVTDVVTKAEGGTQTLFRHGYFLVGANGEVTAKVMSNATFTADGVTFSGLKPKKSASANEAFVEPLPQTGARGTSFTCNCYTKSDKLGTGECSVWVMGDRVRCQAGTCKNNCYLKPVGRPE